MPDEPDIPEIAITDARTGKLPEMQVLEETGVAYDPSRVHLDLTKEEKRRTTALLLAIQAYQHLIIKDAEYLKTAADLARRNEGPVIQPATMNAMVDAAIQFDDFIAGRRDTAPGGIVRGGEQTQEAGDGD